MKDKNGVWATLGLLSIPIGFILQYAWNTIKKMEKDVFETLLILALSLILLYSLTRKKLQETLERERVILASQERRDSQSLRRP